MTGPGSPVSPDGSLRGCYAGFVTRLLATVVDAIVLAVSYAVVVWVVAATVGLVRLESPQSPSGPVWAALAPSHVAVFLLVCWALAGKTPGKALMGVRIVTLDGDPIGVGRALVRLLGYVVSAAPLFAGFAWILVSDRRQGWHDLLARTCVVYDWDARAAELPIPAGLGRLVPRWRTPARRGR